MEHEVPATVFNKSSNGVSEKGLYKNAFGFEFHFSDISLLNVQDELLFFDIGPEISFKIVVLAVNQLSVEFKSKNFNADPVALTFTPGKPIAFRFVYELKQFPNGSRVLKLSVLNENNNLHPLVSDKQSFYESAEVPGLPHEDLNYQRLRLNAKMEQLILTQNAKESQFRFLFDDQYFVYKNERSDEYLLKYFRVKAISRFEEYFPGISHGETVSVSRSVFTTQIYNNGIGKALEFQLNPLLYHEKTKSQHTRSMQLMLLVDRPLRNNEKIALILGESTAATISLTSKTCAIGRDLTTSGNDFLTAHKPSGLPLSDFIVINPVQSYLKKYFPTDAIRTVNGYQVFILEPFYERRKNKWIAVISLDQSMLRQLSLSSGKLLNAYNPFVKIVAARYNDHSFTGNHLSALSLPKYINLLTERMVSVTENAYAGTKVWKVKVDNFAQAKYDEKGMLRSRIVVAIRKPDIRGISHEVLESVEVFENKLRGTAALYHVLKSDTIYIEKLNNAVVCIYEFELFDNVAPDVHSIDWLNEPTVRMIYAEQFQ